MCNIHHSKLFLYLAIPNDTSYFLISYFLCQLTYFFVVPDILLPRLLLVCLFHPTLKCSLNFVLSDVPYCLLIYLLKFLFIMFSDVTFCHPEILPIHNSVRHQRWLERAQNSHCIMGKSRLLNAAQNKFYTWTFQITLKMWIERFHIQIHTPTIIYIHNRRIFFTMITCTIGLLRSFILDVKLIFACKTNGVFSGNVDTCRTGDRNRMGCTFCESGELDFYSI